MTNIDDECDASPKKGLGSNLIRHLEMQSRKRGFAVKLRKLDYETQLLDFPIRLQYLEYEIFRFFRHLARIISR